jgi:hypothetical protein
MQSGLLNRHPEAKRCASCRWYVLTFFHLQSAISTIVTSVTVYVLLIISIGSLRLCYEHQITLSSGLVPPYTRQHDALDITY